MHDQVVLYFAAELSYIADAMLEKMAFVAKTPTMRSKVQAEKHFESEDPNWKRFEKNLKLKTFQDVVSKDPRADEKLKKYVDNFGGYLRSKKVTAKVTSPDTGKAYVIKEIPGGRLACNCGNWQYRKSVDGGDCKHIEAIIMKKSASDRSVSAQKRWDHQHALMAAGPALGVGAALGWHIGKQEKISPVAMAALSALSFGGGVYGAARVGTAMGRRRVARETELAKKVKQAYVSSLMAVAGGTSNLGLGKARAKSAKRRADLSVEATRQLSQVARRG